jgi:hypothetical protein
MARIINLGVFEDFMGNWAQGNVLTEAAVCRKSFESEQRYQRPYLRVVGGRLLFCRVHHISLSSQAGARGTFPGWLPLAIINGAALIFRGAPCCHC